MNDDQNPGLGAQPPADSAEATQPSQQAEERDFEAMRRELEQVRGELRESSAKLEEIARAYASLINDQKDFRARLEREKERVLQSERGTIAQQLLEVSDEIDRALAAATSDEGPLAQGVRLIHEGLRKRLARLGIERLSLVGKPFDPNLAEAVDLVPVAEQRLNDTVTEEVLPGYRLGERILRAAKVRVARYAPDTPAQPEPAESGQT
ncbi:MAG: nucleotide exchange factor GrpE [Myxococcales bacterium]